MHTEIRRVRYLILGILVALFLLAPDLGSVSAATVTYEHDLQGRVKKATYSDGTIVDYSYDGVADHEYGRAALGATDASVGVGALAVGGPAGWTIAAGYTILKEAVPRSIALEVQLCNEGACPVIYAP